MHVVECVGRGMAGAIQAAKLEKVWALLALLSGGVTMARSVADNNTRQLIAANLKRSALIMLEGDRD